jgi:RNA polymerase sigma factor (sigma-70 family)
VGLVDALVRRGVFVASSGPAVLGPAEHADRIDLVQETFARAFTEKARLAYDGLRDYQPYLLAICRNLVFDWARRRGRELATDPVDWACEEASKPEPDHPWADPQTMAVVEQYLAGLGPEQKAVHHQRFVLSVSQEEAARNLGLSRQRIRTLEQKLKKGLRRALMRSRLGRRVQTE